MTKKSNDQRGFTDLMKDVTKIESDRVNIYRDRSKPPGLPKKRSQAANSTPDFASIDFQQRSGLKEALFSPGIQKKLQRKIRQGQLPIEDRLDLHGYNQNQAITGLGRFIDKALAAGFRMLIIIHGKGSRSDSNAVLKPLVRHWLAGRSSVLGWCPAQPKHGGEGACYVYLRSRS